MPPLLYIILSRQTVIGLETPIQDIINDIEPEICKPTKEFKLWLETIKESSQNLRKRNKIIADL